MRLNSSTPGAPGAPAADPFQRAQAGLEAALRIPGFGNGSGNASERVLAAPSSHLDVNTDIYSKALVTAVYLALFAVGTVGNAVTAFTLARKKSLQSLQSTVHYHLGSLALSDLLTLLLAMPVELYNFIWVHHPWAFGDAGCRGYYFVRDACTYATALNVASLSVERYLAICHPFKAKTLMSRSRTKKFISAIWLASGLLAVPMLFTMGQQNRSADGQHPGGLVCTPTIHTATVKTVIQVSMGDHPPEPPLFPKRSASGLPSGVHGGAPGAAATQPFRRWAVEGSALSLLTQEVPLLRHPLRPLPWQKARSSQACNPQKQPQNTGV
ncbi:Neurotensin receptor type 1 [Saguinus oedipus]|uniref:Neurotensin receptor type 1 n=1 Tax=Saguinus oedipus TaxID=9490 RepID=A0ABQ9VLS0_SAGOE|nr:Neurotensin receptor type 1 [Saguinus oedipus]